MLLRDGGGNSEEFVLRGTGVSVCGFGGGGVGFETWLGGASDWLSLSRLISGFVSLEDFPMPQCWASIDLLSSMGVNMLLDLAGAGFCRRFN